MNKIILGNCLDKLKELEENSVDSIVTDPPYELGFMGKSWDNTGIANDPKMWAECLRVLKPGGYLLSFGGTRTYHRMATAIEDAGFEVRDMIEWIYSTGFPKSLNLNKALQKKCKCGNMVAYDNERTKQDTEHDLRPMSESDLSQKINTTAEQGEVLQSELSEQSVSLQQSESTENVRREESLLERGNNIEKTEGELQGSDISEVSKGISSDGKERRIHNATQVSDGTTSEQIIDENGSSASHRPQSEQQQDRKPCAFCKQLGTQETRRLYEATYGVGSALKPAHEPICLARKPLSEKTLVDNFIKYGTGGINIDGSRVATEDKMSYSSSEKQGVTQFGTGTTEQSPLGRFPANLIHDNSEEVRECFPDSKAGSYKGEGSKSGGIWSESTGKPAGMEYGDNGNASRFFKSIIYQAKASKSERNKGCEGLEEKVRVRQGLAGEHKDTVSSNSHPTVKPIALMEYLIKMVTPPIVFVCEKCYNGKYEKQKTNSDTTQLSNMRDRVQATGQSTQGEVLHEEVCISGSENNNRKTLPILQEDVSTQKDRQESTDLLQSPMLGDTYRNNKEEQRTNKNTEGLFGDLQTREQDVKQARDGIATPIDNGGTHREGFTSDRNNTSQEPQERRQQSRELGDNDSETAQCNSETKEKNNLSSLSGNRRCPDCGESMVKRAGVVLDPFAGSGSTLVAAKQNGYQYIGIEMTEEYIPIIKARLNEN